jgi:hypothetical protein
MYKVWHVSISLQDFSFTMFSTYSSLFFFVLATRDFCNWECHNQIALWRIPWHSRPFTTEALGADGESYGVGEEGTLFGLLQTLVSMWSFSGCRFLEGDTSSLWCELKAGDVDKKIPNACLLLHLGEAKVVTIMEANNVGDLIFLKVQA